MNRTDEIITVTVSDTDTVESVVQKLADSGVVKMCIRDRNHAVRFLNSGNKIKVTLRFKSREIQHPELGTKLMERFAAGVSELGVVEKAAKLDGRMMTMILAPKAAK